MAQPEEKYRKPNPCQTSYPEEDIFDFIVNQEGKKIKLKTYRFQPTKCQQPKALLIQFHGLSSHSNHGAHIAKAFADEGYCVLGFDHRGFGKSEGIRGYIESYDTHIYDSQVFVNKIQSIYGQNIPIFLTGLSLGGLTSYCLTQKDPKRFRGAILMAPALKVSISYLTRQVLTVLGTVAPQKYIIPRQKNIISKNPTIQEYINNDPFSYNDKFQPGTLQAIGIGEKESQKTFHKYNCPFLIIQGGLDKLVDTDLGIILTQKAMINDKTHLYYENMWHDIWHEEEINDIIPKAISWANNRI